MAPHNVLVIYKEWVNSILCEDGVQIQSVSQLNTHHLLMRLFRLLPLQKIEADLNLSLSDSQSQADSIGCLLMLLRRDGVRISLQPSDIANGELQAILDIVWILLLHYGIHFGENTPTNQRTTSIGTKLLLKWCSELLGGACFDYRLSMTENMEKDVLHNIINQVTNLVSNPEQPEPCDYHEAIVEAERKLGVSSNLLRVCDSQTENLAVTVYISLLRRKRELILAGGTPTRPSLLVNQHSPTVVDRPRSSLSMHNDKTQQVLKDIERQLDQYHNGFAASSPRHLRELANNAASREQSPSSLSDSHSRVPSTASSATVHSLNMPSPITRAHGSFPNDSSGSLKIDLTHLQQTTKKRSCSISTSPNGVSLTEQTAEFTQLLQQLRDKKRNESGDSEGQAADGTAACKCEDDVDRTSPKSAPNTDEGFGTFTKTTPRGKDSASEGTDDHTDCEVDQLSPEPTSITEWWDKIEMPSMEVTAIDSSLFKSTIVDQSTSRVDEEGQVELADDELMCMLDNIGMSGIKATSGLASAQETELRLLYVLKERDDLVLSYHNALKELSKLTARIKDENHLLRKQLNMTNMSHNEIVLALEEQASDGRRLAMGLQDDLTDTEVNILSRLREDKHVLEDRLAALEHQYNCDLAKWKNDLASCHSKGEISLRQQTGEISRENEMLKLQLEELRAMFDATVSQTQDECSNYLQTIQDLKDQMSSSHAPISEAQIQTLATRQNDMERLYESMIGSLETDNSRLQAELEDLQQEVAHLKESKEQHDKCSGTTTEVADSGVGTEDLDVADKAVNTRIKQSSKATETEALKVAAKSCNTGEDPQLVEARGKVRELEETLADVKEDGKVIQQHKNMLAERINNIESQLHMTEHKLTTLQAVHELVLSKNELLGKDLAEAKERASAEATEKDKLRQQLSAELAKARDDSARLSAETASVRQELSSLQSQCSSYRQREVEMNSELTKLTQERSTLQVKVNSLNSDLVAQKANGVSQSMRVQQLEANKASLESQVKTFKEDSIELFRRLEEARQEKDSLSQELGSLHTQLSESMAQWKRELGQQTASHQQVKANLESEVNAHKGEAAIQKAQVEKLTLELGELRGQLRVSREISNKIQSDMKEVFRTAKVEEGEGAVEQLHELLKSLLKQTAEYKFTTTHFRSENGQLQLRVNQLEDLNKSIEERNKILQTELTTVQASLDDSYSSADAQLNLLDLSVSDLMSINDTSELRNYILAAKSQVEMMQNQRAKSNLEYSRKIFEMEKLVKDKSRSSSEVVPSTTDSASGSTDSTSGSTDSASGSTDSTSGSTDSASGASKSVSDYKSASTDYVAFPPHLDVNSSAGVTAAILLDKSQSSIGSHQVAIPAGEQVIAEVKVHQPQVSTLPSNGIQAKHSAPHMTSVTDPTPQSSKLQYIPDNSLVSGQHTNKQHAAVPVSVSHTDVLPSDISDIELADGADNLSLRVQSLTNRPGTSTPTRKSFDTLLTASRASATEASNATNQLSAIESENAALRAELKLLNSDRHSLHQHMEKQVVQHDVLNDTLDELEKSLEEVCDSNKLLRDTLGDCNNYIQTNILSQPASASTRSSRFVDASTKSYSHSTARPHSMTPATGSYVTPANRSYVTPANTRSYSVTPANRSYSVTPASRSYNVTPANRSHSVTSSATSLTTRAPAYSEGHQSGSNGGWSAETDHQMTSSFDFNKLQQTNVRDYESLLLSDTNTKSASRYSPAASKAADLNHMIQHSLSKLDQVHTGSPSLGANFTSTPVKSSRHRTSIPEYI